MKYYIFFLMIFCNAIFFGMDPAKARIDRQIKLEYDREKLYTLMIEELTERKKEREARKSHQEKNSTSEQYQPNVELKLHQIQPPKL